LSLLKLRNLNTGEVVADLAGPDPIVTYLNIWIDEHFESRPPIAQPPLTATFYSAAEWELEERKRDENYEYAAAGFDDFDDDDAFDEPDDDGENDEAN